ncbi:hypothetical protein ACHAXA_001219 [Cyclostephanos tholiformis]|uniref:Uncharacterized protein n=1 Tax=Cyclostephanos tholiformis TaxID=382380 RepID=A0ABD3SQR1_9STRA
MIVDMFVGIIECMSRDDESTSSFVRCVGPRRLVRDVLRPVAVIQVARGGIIDMRDGGKENEWNLDRAVSSRRYDYYDRLIAITSSYLALPHSLERLTALEISITLWSMTKIYNPPRASGVIPAPTLDDRPPLTIQSPQGVLLRAYMKRLRKYSVRSIATGKDLARALWSVARLVVYFEGRDETSSRAIDCSPSFEQLIPFTTRLPGEDECEFSYSFGSLMGKSVEVGTMSIIRPPLIPTPRARQTKHIRKSYDSPDEALKVVLHNEAVIMFHTLVNEIVRPPAYPISNSGGVPGEDDGIYRTKLESLSLWHVSEMLQAATTLQISHDEIIPAIIKVLQHLTSSSWRNPIRRCRNCKDISRILLSLQRLRVGTGIFDDAIDGDVDRGGDTIDIACGTVDGSDLITILVSLTYAWPNWNADAFKI